MLRTPADFGKRKLSASLSGTAIGMFLDTLSMAREGAGATACGVGGAFGAPLSRRALKVPPCGPFVVMRSRLGRSHVRIRLIGCPPARGTSVTLFRARRSLSSMPADCCMTGNGCPFTVRLDKTAGFGAPRARPVSGDFRRFVS